MMAYHASKLLPDICLAGPCLNERLPQQQLEVSRQLMTMYIHTHTHMNTTWLCTHINNLLQDMPLCNSASVRHLSIWLCF